MRAFLRMSHSGRAGKLFFFVMRNIRSVRAERIEQLAVVLHGAAAIRARKLYGLQAIAYRT